MENNIDKDIRDLLNNPPDFVPGAFDFAALESRLDAPPVATLQESVSTQSRGMWWAVGLLLLALLSGGTWFWMQLDAAKQKVSDLEQQLAVKTTSEKTENHQIVTIYDTVYQTVTILQKETRPSTFDSNQKDSNRPSFSEYSSEIAKTNSSTLNQENSTALFKNNTNSTISKTFIDKNDIPRILSLTPQALAISQNISLNAFGLTVAEEPLRKKKGINLWAMVRPQSTQIGVNFNPWNRFMINGQIRKSSNTAINVDLKYGRNWRISTGLEFFKVYQEIDAITDDISYYPIAKSNDRRDILQEVALDSRFLQIPLGLRYVFMPDKFLRPYLHTSVLARRVLQQNFSYTYAERFDPHFLNRQFTVSPFLFSGVKFGTGIEIDMYSRLSARLEGYYSRDFNNPAYQYDRLIYWGVNGGLNFEF